MVLVLKYIFQGAKFLQLLLPLLGVKGLQEQALPVVWDQTQAILDTHKF